jgi:hypothetical protein
LPNDLPESPSTDALPAIDPAPRLHARLARPWLWLLAVASVCAVAARLYAEQVLASVTRKGATMDLMLEGAVVGVISIGVMWAPMFSMRVARRAWPRLGLPVRLAALRQVALQGVLLGPALTGLVAWGTESLPASRLLGPSVAGCVLVSLGGAASLWLRRHV